MADEKKVISARPAGGRNRYPVFVFRTFHDDWFLTAGYHAIKRLNPWNRWYIAVSIIFVYLYCQIILKLKPWKQNLHYYSASCFMHHARLHKPKLRLSKPIREMKMLSHLRLLLPLPPRSPRTATIRLHRSAARVTTSPSVTSSARTAMHRAYVPRAQHAQKEIARWT